MDNIADTLPEIHTRWFVGKKLESVTGGDPYIRYTFEGGGYFEQYQHLGELNWIKVENGHPNNSPVGPDTDQVLIMTDRVYYPNIGTATGEWTEDGFVWHPDNPKVLEPEWCNNYKPINVTHWAFISRPIEHEGKESA
jgi:hypothetical protein